MKDVYKYTLRLENDVPRATEESRKIVQENCIHCHETMIKSVNPVLSDVMKPTEWDSKQCWDCHRQVPHTRVRGLASASNTEMQTTSKPVSDWLDKKLDQNNKK